jgi:hypothetical protein
MLDARITFMILPTLLFIRWYTVLPTVVLSVILWWVEKRLEMDISSALRAVRCFFAGSRRPTRAAPKRRHPVDYDRYGQGG